MVLRGTNADGGANDAVSILGSGCGKNVDVVCRKFYIRDVSRSESKLSRIRKPSNCSVEMFTSSSIVSLTLFDSLLYRCQPSTTV